MAGREKLGAVVYADKTVDEQTEKLQQIEGSGRSWQLQPSRSRCHRLEEVESFLGGQCAQELPGRRDCTEQR